MTVDLDTLLRDAGREPTIDLDVDEVHTRGRRRTRVRRFAVGAGALVLVGGLALGVPQLLGADRPGLDPIDDAPAIEGPSDVPVLSVGTTSRAALASELGRDLQLHRHEVDTSAVTTWTVERTRPDGTSDTRSLELPLLASDPVVDRDGGVWGGNDYGVLLRDGERLSGPDRELTGAWLPIGTDENGNVVVRPRPGIAGDETPDGPQLHTVDSEGSVLPSNLDQVTAALPADASLFAFDEAREHAVVLGSVVPPDSRAAEQLLLLVPYGGEPRDLLAEPPVADAVGDSTVTMVHIVGDQVWLAVVAPDDGTFSLDRTSRIIRVPLDPEGDVTVLPTPDPQGMNRLDGQVESIEATDDGEVVLLGRRALPDFPAPYVVRPAMADALADGAITALDARGVPTLLPRSDGGATTGLADCPAEDRNAPPEVNGEHLWFACFGDGSSLDPFPFLRVEPAPEEAQGLELLRGLVEQYLAGPSAADAEWGAHPLVPPGSAELVAVEADGRRVTITVASTAEPGVPTGSTDGWAFRVALAALGVQFDAYDEAVVVTDGTCGDWEGTTDPAAADNCIVWTEQDMPWSQAGL